MRKWLNKPWFVGLLALGAIGAAVQSVLSDRPNYGGTPEPVAAVAEEATTEESQSAEQASALGVAAPVSGTGLREVFAPPAKNSAPDVVEEKVTLQKETFLLTALWSQAGELLCYVNGHICHVGDAVGSARIIDANMDGVWIGHSLGRDFLNVGQPFILVLPAANGAVPVEPRS